MTTAQVQHASAGELAEAQIRATVRALMGAYKVRTAELARVIGTSRATMYNKLDGKTPFSAGEVAEMADYFGCSVQEIYGGTVTVSPGGQVPGGRRDNNAVNHRYRVANTGSITARPASRPPQRRDSRRPGANSRDRRADARRLEMSAAAPVTDGERLGRDLRPSRSATRVMVTGAAVTDRYREVTCPAA